MDNFFTSVSLYNNLLNGGIYATGTALVQRRNFLQAFVSVAKHGLPLQGDTAFRQDSNLSVTVWPSSVGAVWLLVQKTQRARESEQECWTKPR